MTKEERKAYNTAYKEKHRDRINARRRDRYAAEVYAEREKKRKNASEYMRKYFSEDPERVERNRENSREAYRKKIERLKDKPQEMMLFRRKKSINTLLQYHRTKLRQLAREVDTSSTKWKDTVRKAALNNVLDPNMMMYLVNDTLDESKKAMRLDMLEQQEFTELIRDIIRIWKSM